MTHALTCCLYYFRCQRIMSWITAIGLILMLSSVLLQARTSIVVLALGATMAFGFPTMVAGIVFRQLIGNLRFIMVPGFRRAAAGGLFLLVIASTGMTLVVTEAIRSWSPDSVTFSDITIAALTFSLISGYVLMSQWLLIYSLGLFALIALPLIVLRASLVDSSILASLTGDFWLLFALALTGWIWLFVTMRGGERPSPVATFGSEIGSSGDPNNRPGWRPQFGPVATAAGTLVRGYRDGWQNRLTGILITVLAMPAGLLVVLWLLGQPLDGRRSAAGFFLTWSLFGAAAQVPLSIREWPARLRFLWLRQAGDRRAAWQHLERALVRDIAIIAVVSVFVAMSFWILSEIDRTYLLLYVAGCVLLTAVTSYFGFLSRASGWPTGLDVFFGLFAVALCFVPLLLLEDDIANSAYEWLIPSALVALAVIRMLARRAVLKIDWCVARPVRPARAHRLPS